MGGGGPLTGDPRAGRTFRVRWLGRVAYRDALALQRGLFVGSDDNLLLLEHPHTITRSRRTPRDHLLVDEDEIRSVGGEVVETDRGGDITYHGPGQLVGYPILDVPGRRGGGMADTAAYVDALEQILIDVLGELGLAAGRIPRFSGVWVDVAGARPRKIAAIGVRISRSRSMHGFALNVDPDLSWFDRIVPCGISDKGVTSLAAEGIDVTMESVVDRVAHGVVTRFAGERAVDRADVSWRIRGRDLAPFTRGEGAGTPVGRDGVGHGFDAQADGTSVRLLGRLADAGATDHDPVRLRARKPDWMKVPLATGPEFRRVKAAMRELDLVTVCEEAGCPNISECWNDGTATFMVLGERCTRACGFCLVDTRRPAPPDPGEPARVATAVQRLGLRHAVITMVARDDLADGGASAVAATVEAVRAENPHCRIETLISDFQGNDAALDVLFAAGPDIVNHNIETVARLQRAVRPSAGYARSLSVLARAKAAGFVIKSSLIVGMGETGDEIEQTLGDLAAVGTDIVTIGQYLRPTSHHLPVARWWEPARFAEWRRVGERAGIGHVESSPLTRSSYHAREAAASVSGSS